jgi:hypothetical protein
LHVKLDSSNPDFSSTSFFLAIETQSRISRVVGYSSRWSAARNATSAAMIEHPAFVGIVKEHARLCIKPLVMTSHLASNGL